MFFIFCKCLRYFEVKVSIKFLVDVFEIFWVEIFLDEIEEKVRVWTSQYSLIERYVCEWWDCQNENLEAYVFWGDGKYGKVDWEKVVLPVNMRQLDQPSTLESIGSPLLLTIHQQPYFESIVKFMDQSLTN